MKPFSQCYVCRADKKKARHLAFYSFPSGLTDHMSDQVWRSKFLAALKFPQEIINKPPSKIEMRSVICSRHFMDSCFISNGDGEISLFHGSVPKLFLGELRNKHVQVEVTISDDEDDDVQPQLNHYLDEMAYSPHSKNDDIDKMPIPELTANLDRQEKRKDETPSIGSESDIFIPVHIEKPQKKDTEEIDLASDVDSCASTVLYEDDRPATPLVKVFQNAESVQNDRGGIIVDPDLDDVENILNEELMSPGTSALCEDLIDGFSIKSFLTEEDMEVYSDEHCILNQSAGVSITKSTNPREFYEEPLAGAVSMDSTTMVKSGCSSSLNSSACANDNRNYAATREVVSTPINQARRLPILDWPIHSWTGVLRSVPTILSEQVEVDDGAMVATPPGEFILDNPFQHSNTILARDLFLDINALDSSLDEPSGLPDSPNESLDVTLDEPEDLLAPCGKVYCTLGCICDSLLTSRPPCGHFFCQDGNSCTKHARARRHFVDSNLLDMRREEVEERRDREMEGFIRENDGLQKRQALRELYDIRCNLKESKRENALLRSKLTDQLEETQYMKDILRPRPIEPPSSSGSTISGKDGVPLSERLMNDWASTLYKNSPCEFVARLVAEMFTEDYLVNGPELQEGHIQAIISATMKRYKTCYLDGKKKERSKTLTADWVKEFIRSVLKTFRE